MAIDDHTRIDFSAIYPDETQASAVAFLQAALAYYARLGIRFKAILTDNGPAYRSRAMAAACKSLGLKHRFTRPYTPRTNGKAERFIQTALREWAYAGSYSNSNERSQELRPSMSLVHCQEHEFTDRVSILHSAVAFALKFLSGREPGGVQRQSLKLPYAGWLPHERVSSQACLGLSAGVG